MSLIRILDSNMKILAWCETMCRKRKLIVYEIQVCTPKIIVHGVPVSFYAYIIHEGRQRTEIANVLPLCSM